jgi:hypothetical protein
MKDNTIRELRTEVISKALKIDKLKNRISSMEAEILEFANEFDKIKNMHHKKNVFGATMNQTMMKGGIFGMGASTASLPTMNAGNGVKTSF